MVTHFITRQSQGILVALVKGSHVRCPVHDFWYMLHENDNFKNCERDHTLGLAIKVARDCLGGNHKMSSAR